MAGCAGCRSAAVSTFGLNGSVTDAQVIEVRRLIDGLRWDRRRDPYRGRREYAARAGEVAAEIDHLIKREAAARAVPLARRAVERVTSTLMYLDDSPGIVGDQLRELMFLYAEACKAAPPDAGRLAAWLVKTRLDGPGWPDIRLAEFKDALGNGACARPPGSWRSAAPPMIRIPGRPPWACGTCVSNSRRSQGMWTRMWQCWPRIYAAPTATPRSCRCCGRPRDAEAERWAREGLARDGAGHQADVLRDRLVDLLLDHGRGDEAIALRRAALEHRTMHIDYMALRKTAERAAGGPTCATRR